MDAPEPVPAASLEVSAAAMPVRHRLAWHALAAVIAAIVAWLVFTAYRQPDLILDLAGMRLC
jgi:hypothetical protein